MSRADLHVHSKYSMDGDEWVLRTLGVRESYTDIETVYRIAKLRKMDFVALTDHNTIDGALKLASLYPQDTIVGCEFSVFFPENGCKLHLLVYDLQPHHFEKIMSLRFNVYQTRDYIRDEGLAYSVAHATLSVNGKLDTETLEKTILLFDVFENINGAHSANHNRGWEALLDRLTPADLERLSEKHGIKPFGDNSWSKGLTGGSDDHAGLFIGQTFTVAPCRTKKDFIQCLKDKKTFGLGRHHDHKAMALSLMLIGGRAWSDLSRSWLAGLVFKEISHLISGGLPRSCWKLLGIGWFFRCKQTSLARIFGSFLTDMLDRFRKHPRWTADQKVSYVYQKLSSSSDLLVRTALIALTRKTNHEDRLAWLKKGLVAGAFFGAPVFTSLKVLSKGRDLTGRIRFGENGFVPAPRDSAKRVLWFSDLIARRKKVEAFFCSRDFPDAVKIRVAVCTHSRGVFSSGKVLRLPMAGALHQKWLGDLPVKIPSILEGLSKIEAWDPEEIVIDTPGPMGLMGLVAARLLNVKCYRTFTPGAWPMDLRGRSAEEKELLSRGLRIFCDFTDGIYRVKGAVSGFERSWFDSAAEPENFEHV